MRSEAMVDIDTAALETEVGATTYSRGETYARRGHVVNLRWDEDERTLHGKVVGKGALYTTTARLTSYDGKVHHFSEGDCSCPVGFDCKHVVAILLSASEQRRERVQPAKPQIARRPESWEQALTALLAAAPVDDTRGTPLAVELSVAPHGQSYRPLARVVRPGKTGGWVNGRLTWSGLGVPTYGEGPRPAHVRALQELHAASGATRSGYYGYGGEKSLDLSTFDSAQLWPLLDQAQAAGVRLVHGRKQLGEVKRIDQVQLCLDVVAGKTADGLAVRPVLTVDGVPIDAVPVAFIGSNGHGVVYVDREDLTGDPKEWRLQLARLDRPAPAELQELARSRRQLEIPAAARARFRTEFYPRLRTVTTVFSSDEGFVPPRISPPTLVLTASYGDGHELGLRWEWSYSVDETTVRVPLYATARDTLTRDPQAERELLDRLGAEVSMASFGLWAGGTIRPLAAQAELSGIDTMRFSTEVLPLLDGLPGVVVEVTGDQADYREAGDSLRIGVSATAGEPGQTDWFDLGVTISVEDREVPFTDVFVGLSRGDSHLLLADGAYFSLEKPELQALRRLIEEARALQSKPDEPLRVSRFQAGFFGELAELGVVDQQTRAWQRQVDGLLTPGAVAALPAPSGLDATLRPYQAEGFGWLAFLWEHRLGGVLADDMGLGKTLQSLALIRRARTEEPAAAPFLIVAPTSVVSNWKAEAARFTPSLAVVTIADTLKRRGQALVDVVAGADVVVTSYTLFRLDIEAYSSREWSGLLLDEAQFVKNHQSKAYQCARRLPAPFKLAITGTPMENNLMELWSMLSITAPGLFPSPERFREYYARPIEQGDTELLAQLRRRIRPLMKRRTKEQVAADLPAKQQQVLEVELHPKHRKLYERQLQRSRQEVLGLVDDLDRNRFAILRSLTLLRQLSLHAGLVDEEHRDLPSSKVDLLVEQLGDVVAGSHRALVFSQFTGFLDVVRRRLEAEGIDYCYLDGKTRDRAAVVERFKQGAAPVFLISLKAGGFGLNLTEADYCFLLDPWWNPATEAQAIDRTHRIGQTRNVMVYRLIAAGTIEEKVMALKNRKAELFSSVMDDGDTFGGTLGADEIRELFS